MKIKLLHSLCITIVLSAFTTLLKGQASQSNYFLPSFYPKAPNTGSLEKFGSYDVNLFTGLPNISIPLYTVDAGGLKVPITLSYHASGVRVSEVSSWAGLGWAVSAGGSINRKIVGKADESESGYFYSPARTAASFTGTTDADIDSLNRINNGTYDSRPDIFSYDFPGHGGKFFFDGTNNFKPAFIPFAPIRIDSGNGLLKLNLTDEHGNNYTFGDQYVETTNSGSQSHWPTSAITAWPLEKMISQNRRDTVSFTYSQQTVVSPDVISNTDLVDDQISNGSGAIYTYGYKQGQQSISTSSVTEQLIQHIYFKNGRIDFETESSLREDLLANQGNNAHALKFIKVYIYNYSSRSMELQKTIQFFHTYFNPGNSGFERLKLDSIQVQDKSGASVQHYGFTYNTTVAMPFYGSNAKDYWGFYNGKDSFGGQANNSLTPQMAVQTLNNGSTGSITIGSNVPNNRISDSVKMQSCVLTSIAFPTGGHTDFTYQANRYYDNTHTLVVAGGLRIKSISSYDNINATPIVKTYQYDDNVARPNFILDNVFFATFQTHKNWSYTGGNFSLPQVTDTEYERVFVSNPRIDLEPFDAAIVVYPTVSEYTGTPGTNIGRTDYSFRDLSDIEDIASMTGIPVIKSYFYARGQLLNKGEYLHKADGSYQIVKIDANTYTAFTERRYANVGLVVGKNIVNEGVRPILYPSEFTSAISLNGFVVNNYDIRSDDNYLTSTTTTNYDLADPSKYTTSTVTYDYGADTTHQQIINTIHVDSKGNTRTTNNKYAFNYPAGNAVLDTMVNRHMYAEGIERSETYKIGAAASQTTSAQLSQFKTGSLSTAIVPDKISILNIPGPVTNFTPSSVSAGALTKDSRYTQMISFDSYDYQNNLSQYTPRNSAPVSVLWDYLYEKPIAQVKNATNNTFAYTSFEADGTGNFSYTGPTVTDPTAPTGNRVYVLSGGAITSSALNTAKAYVLSVWSNNGAPTVIAGSSLTGMALRTNSNWTYYEYQVPAGNSSVSISGATTIDDLRLYPADAQMTTYAYDPNGVTDIADTKGAINHFDYDAFARLKNVKDWAGNIVKNYGYHTYDQVKGNAAIGATTFTRNNCPAGTSPTSTSYSVPANKYYASTTADANAEATYDLNTNGQIKANTVCGCPIQYISVTLTNNTGHAGYQATFSGIATPYNFPTTGSTVISVPAGTYATLSINPVGTFTATFTLGTRTPVTAHFTSFSTVVIGTGSPDLTLSIN